MATRKGKSFSATKNLHVQDGLIRLGRAQASGAVPFETTDIGVYVNSNGDLVFSYNGVESVVQGSKSTDRTATADGTGTGVIAPSSDFVQVTSASADNIITLPAPVVGKRLVINVGANGFKLQTTDPATIAINGGTGAGVKSTIAASSTLVLYCVSATSWKGFFMDADSDVAKIPAAA